MKLDDPSKGLGLVLCLFGMGACAMIYTFSVITSIAFVLGERIYVYSIFVGIFLIAVGVGLYLTTPSSQANRSELLKAQLILGLIGVIGLPVLVSLFASSEFAIRQGLGIPHWVHALFLWIIGATGVFFIGYFSGRQVPFLADLLKAQRYRKQPLKILLSFDYLGFVVGALLFPLLLFPYLGLFRSFYLASLFATSLSMATYFLLRAQQVRHLWWVSITLVLGLVGFALSRQLEASIYSMAYGGG